MGVDLPGRVELHAGRALARARHGLTSIHLLHEREAADMLGIPYEQVTQGALIPVAYTLGTDFKPGRRAAARDDGALGPLLTASGSRFARSRNPLARIPSAHTPEGVRFAAAKARSPASGDLAARDYGIRSRGSLPRIPLKASASRPQGRAASAARERCADDAGVFAEARTSRIAGRSDSRTRRSHPQLPGASVSPVDTAGEAQAAADHDRVGVEHVREAGDGGAQRTAASRTTLQSR